jgi:hypothetical protein
MLLLLILSVACGVSAEETDFSYHVRLGWTGPSDMTLILRNPKDAIMDVDFAPLDCYEGQPNPDWGIQDQSIDDPIWAYTKVGETNYEHIISSDLFDIGTYVIIARAFSGAATCTLDIVRWQNKDDNTRTVKYLTTDQNGTREWRSNRSSKYFNMFSRILKFKQKKGGNTAGKFLIKCNYTQMTEELDTNDAMRVYLNEDRVFTDNGNWQFNKKKTKYWIDNPWSVKVFQKNKNEIYIRGIASSLYKSANVNCNIVIGEYLGTNSFITDRKCLYKYKERYELNPKLP